MTKGKKLICSSNEAGNSGISEEMLGPDEKAAYTIFKMGRQGPLPLKPKARTFEIPGKTPITQYKMLSDNRNVLTQCGTHIELWDLLKVAL